MRRHSVAEQVVLYHVGDGIEEPRLVGDVGYDLVVDRRVVVPPRSFRNVPHEAAVQLPDGYWGLLLARSSVNIGGRLVVLPGLIDTGYRGQLFGLVHNMTDESIVLQEGSRVCQLVLVPAMVIPLVAVRRLAPSERSARGFGSTGGTNGTARNPNYPG